MGRAAVLVSLFFIAMSTWQEAIKERRGLFSPTVSEAIVHRGEGTGRVAGGLGILTSKQNRNWEENTGA